MFLISSLHTKVESQKMINNSKLKNATGGDKILTKLLKLGKPTLVKPIANFINTTIGASTFLSRFINAQVTPLHKKNDPMLKSNYRPISILQIPSKYMKRPYLNSCPAISVLFLMIFSVLSKRDMDAKLLFYAFSKTGNMPLILINMLQLS